MASSYKDNALDADLGENIGEAVKGIGEKWRNLPRKAKGWIAGGTAAATLAGIGGGLALTGHEEELSPEDVQSGQLDFDAGQQPMRDASGKAALMNYFAEDVAEEDRVLRVSLATRLPDAFRDGHQQGDYLDTVENAARSHTHRTEIYYVTVCHSDSNGGQNCHPEMRTRTVTDHHYYRYDLDIEDDFVPANSTQAQQLREYFREFEQLTGIRVEVTENDQDAHITVANYRNAPNYYRGTLDYVRPGDISTYPQGVASGQGAALQRNIVIMNDRNWGEDKGLLDAIGKPLGFEDGKVNIVTLRAELERLGFPVAPLAAQDNSYALDDGVQMSRMLPDNVIIDNGGTDTILGSDKNDTLVSEAGYCGRIDTPRNKFTNIFGDGRQYCIAEGEIEIVRAGAGDDLVITSRGGSETIEPGAGEDRIAYFQPEIGDTTILAAAGEEGSNTLYLHATHVANGNVAAQAEGEDIVLQFSALSGRPTGSITLPGQLAGGGIDRIVVVDNKGEPLFEKDVAGLDTLGEWQQDVVAPMEKSVESKPEELAARWRNQVRRRRDEELDVEGPFI